MNYIGMKNHSKKNKEIYSYREYILPKDIRDIPGYLRSYIYFENGELKLSEMGKKKIK